MALKAQAAPGMSNVLYIMTGCGKGYMAAHEHPKALGDLVESVVGAVFVDTGLSLARTYPVCSNCPLP